MNAIHPLVLKLLRLYTYYSPIAKGKYRLASAVLRDRGLPSDALVRAKDGRVFRCDLRQPAWRDVYLLGTYEPMDTAIVSKMIARGDVVLDIGANIGWYTTLFRRLVGSSGAVHSFEPVPSAFAQLKMNVDLNDPAACNVVLNNMAVGERMGKAVVHVFQGLPDGCASLSTLGRQDYSSHECPMVTLDAYLLEKEVPKVALVKCDVEGAELSVLKGSQTLLSSAEPPIWMIELNPPMAAAWGHSVWDILHWLEDSGPYESYRPTRHGLQPVTPAMTFSEQGASGNAICLIPKLHASRAQDVLVQA